MRRLLIDVTQYASWPATTGVQRTMFHIASLWTGVKLEARYGVLRGREWSTGPLEVLTNVIRDTFDAGEHVPSTSGVGARLVDDGTLGVPVATLGDEFDAYLLPEPTLLGENIELARALSHGRRPIPFFIYYDALPLTHPHGFRPADGGERAFTHYCRALLRAPNVAFISAHARETFEQRVARSGTAGGIVLRLGADGIERVTHSDHTSRIRFTMLGTVEPRKRQRSVLDAFERLWEAGRDYELVLIGSRGPEWPDLFARISALERVGRLRWFESASDRLVAEMISASTAVIFVPEAEGYGLPAVEALALGCPVVVSADVPSLEGISDAGQIRLNPVDVDSLTVAIDKAADPATNENLRHELRQLSLPTWAESVSALENWIDHTLKTAVSS